MKIGDKVISREYANNNVTPAWTYGLTGTIIPDEYHAGKPYWLVRFDRDEAYEAGHGRFKNEWFVRASMLELVKDNTITIGTPTLAGDLRLTPQTRKILAHLEEGKSITNNESMLVYHIYRLSDCIFKLRKAGYNIDLTMKEDGVGGKYASYKLVKPVALAA